MVISDAPVLTEETSLSHFFRDAVQKAAVTLEITLEDHSEFYLVQLLTDFCRTKDFYYKEGKKLEDLPLAILLERAVHSSEHSKRFQLFKKLGDIALFVAGCFPQRTQRHTNKDYYISMGSGAYQSLSSMFPGDSLSDIFAELSDKFESCVLVLEQVKRGARTPNNLDLLELYERWLSTGCERTEKLLQQAGIPTTQRQIITQ